MLDLHNPVSNSSSNSSIMSRKRTRSKSEDVISNHFTQPVPMTDPEGAPRQSLNIAAPFSYEDAPTRIRNSFEYTRITYEMAKEGLAPRPVRVYADGAFDLFHQGHARVLMQAKKALPNVYLIVGVCSDKMLHKRKGRTVLTEEERYNAIRHCRYVDEVVPDAPWTITDEFLEQHKIDFVAHDDVPYASGSSDDIYEHIKKRGMFLVTERTEGVSTSDIVSRIVKDYDVYLRRNLERGYSAKELNVSYLKEKRIKLQSKMGELKDKARDKGKKVVGAIDDFVTVWEDKSREVIDNFLLLFSKKRLRTIWDKSTGKLIKALTPPDSSSESDDDYKPNPKRMRFN